MKLDDPRDDELQNSNSIFNLLVEWLTIRLQKRIGSKGQSFELLV